MRRRLSRKEIAYGMYVKKGDNVIVIAGKDKGKHGKILKVFRESDKVVVEGANLMKRRERSRKEGQKGQVVSVAMPLHVSNILLLSPSATKGTRIGKKLIDGRFVRVSKKGGVPIP